MKIKLQELWRNGQHWDEELPEDLQQFVKDWTTNTAYLNGIKIPRYYNLPTAQPIELHVFCDASTQAVATVIFIRFADKTVYRTKFVMGKPESLHWKHQSFRDRNYKQQSTHADYKEHSSITQPCRSQKSHTGKTAHFCYIGYTTLTTNRKRVLPTDYMKYGTLQL